MSSSPSMELSNDTIDIHLVEEVVNAISTEESKIKPLDNCNEIQDDCDKFQERVIDIVYDKDRSDSLLVDHDANHATSSSSWENFQDPSPISPSEHKTINDECKEEETPPNSIEYCNTSGHGTSEDQYGEDVEETIVDELSESISKGEDGNISCLDENLMDKHDANDSIEENATHESEREASFDGLDLSIIPSDIDSNSISQFPTMNSRRDSNSNTNNSITAKLKHVSESVPRLSSTPIGVLASDRSLVLSSVNLLVNEVENSSFSSSTSTAQSPRAIYSNDKNHSKIDSPSCSLQATNVHNLFDHLRPHKRNINSESKFTKSNLRALAKNIDNTRRPKLLRNLLQELYTAALDARDQQILIQNSLVDILILKLKVISGNDDKASFDSIHSCIWCLRTLTLFVQMNPKEYFAKIASLSIEQVVIHVFQQYDGSQDAIDLIIELLTFIYWLVTNNSESLEIFQYLGIEHQLKKTLDSYSNFPLIERYIRYARSALKSKEESLSLMAYFKSDGILLSKSFRRSELSGDYNLGRINSPESSDLQIEEKSTLDQKSQVSLDISKNSVENSDILSYSNEETEMTEILGLHQTKENLIELNASNVQNAECSSDTDSILQNRSESSKPIEDHEYENIAMNNEDPEVK